MNKTLNNQDGVSVGSAAVRVSGCTGPVAALMRQLGEVVEALSDAQYAQSPVGVIESSVGSHLRHVLDHVRAGLDSVSCGGTFSYDHRARGTAVESSRVAALAMIDGLVTELAAIPADAVDRPIRLSVLMTSDGEPVSVVSSVGRELAFVMQHTVHHNAMIAAMMKTMGVALPKGFGYAPATQKHLTTVAGETNACAR